MLVLQLIAIMEIERSITLGLPNEAPITYEPSPFIAYGTKSIE